MTTRGKSQSPALSAGTPELEVQKQSGVKRRSPSDAEDAPQISKRAAKRRKKATDRADYDEIDEERQINPAIARMDGSLLADHVARQIKHFEKDLSAVELEDRRLPVSAIRDTSGWQVERTLEQLPSFLEQTSGLSRDEFKQCAQKKSRPHTLVITAAGIRAADVTRALRVYQTKKASVAKLFAKHIKLKDAIEAAKQTRMNVGVGTPQRLIDLVENDALSLESVTRVVIDASHVDQKKRGILDMRETLLPLLQFLSMPKLRSRFIEEKAATTASVLFF